MRIVVPFVVGWMVVWPLVMFFAGLGYFGLDRTIMGFTSGYVLLVASPLHLWFLEYLILLYLLAAIAVTIVPLVLSQRARHGALQVPVLRIVAVYAIPFAFGWLLFLNTDLLEVLPRRAWLHSALAVVATVAYRYSYDLPLDPAVKFYVIRAVHPVDMWLLILGVAGLFLRYLADHSAYRRYLCDSSYFLYIAHMPTILVFQLLLENVSLPPLAKIFIVLAGTIAVLLPLYRFAVRPTFIGAVLNGRRYPSTIGMLESGPRLEAHRGEDRRAQDAVH